MIIGLTGNIATGKSTISAMFKNTYHIPVIDADIVSRQVVEPGETAYQQIIETFGEEVIQEDQTINRKKLGEIIFQDDRARQKLNAIVHPAVRTRMEKEKNDQLEAGATSVVLDIPLLFENNLTYLVDRTIVVYADEKTQLERLIDRNQLTEKEARNRMNSQMNIKEKVRKADAVIDNNGTVEHSADQLKDILNRWEIV